MSVLKKIHNSSKSDIEDRLQYFCYRWTIALGLWFDSSNLNLKIRCMVFTYSYSLSFCHDFENSRKPNLFLKNKNNFGYLSWYMSIFVILGIMHEQLKYILAY